MNPGNCPLCGGNNHCAAEKLPPGEETASLDCWCFHASIPKELLARIPAEQRGKACVCGSCVQSFLDGDNAPQ